MTNMHTCRLFGWISTIELLLHWCKNCVLLINIKGKLCTIQKGCHGNKIVCSGIPGLAIGASRCSLDTVKDQFWTIWPLVYFTVVKEFSFKGVIYIKGKGVRFVVNT